MMAIYNIVCEEHRAACDAITSLEQRLQEAHSQEAYNTEEQVMATRASIFKPQPLTENELIQLANNPNCSTEIVAHVARIATRVEPMKSTKGAAVSTGIICSGVVWLAQTHTMTVIVSCSVALQQPNLVWPGLTHAWPQQTVLPTIITITTITTILGTAVVPGLGR